MGFKFFIVKFRLHNHIVAGNGGHLIQLSESVVIGFNISGMDVFDFAFPCSIVVFITLNVLIGINHYFELFTILSKLSHIETCALYFVINVHSS